MNIRSLTTQDVPVVESIFAKYWTDPEFLTELTSEMTHFLTEDNAKNFFLASEDQGEITGVVAYNQTPEYLQSFTSTEKPVELYVIAASRQGEGIGRQLKQAIVTAAAEASYSEIVLFSPESHKASWEFHDSLDFQRMGKVTPPEDDLGMVWRKIL